VQALLRLGRRTWRCRARSDRTRQARRQTQSRHVAVAQSPTCAELRQALLVK
jgi:hypothetical protein